MGRPLRTLCCTVFITSLLIVPVVADAADATPAGGTGAAVTTPPAAPVTPLPLAPLVPPLVASPELKKVELPPSGPIFKIGYVDLSRVGKESVTGKEVQARLKAKGDKLQSQITAKQKQLEKQKKALEEKMPALPPDQRAAKAKEFEKKVEEYRKFVQKADKEMQPLQEELTGKLLREIELAAGSYGKANGFSAILVKKELLYLDNNVDVKDVTGPILKLVDEKGAKP